MNTVKKIAVLTSGGDAPGMNAAIRGVVRAALNKGWEVYGVRDAYWGLVKGGEFIFPLDWVDVSWTFREGGTFLGSARYPELKGTSIKSRELKERALLNLKKRGISGLVVIGGDGSLTGGYDLFTLVTQSEHISPELKGMELSIIGIPGSIDNDVALTDMSIGVDTTLNTIVECIDKLRDTATSHKRIIIVEVMGRRRGYLAVMSGLATGADRVFIREEKINQEGMNRMLLVLQESFAHGQKAGLIIRAEGASFSTNFLKETVDVLLEPKREVRETVLGHLQRGGNPTAFERILATRMGVKAIQLLEKVLPEPQLVGLSENRIKPVALAKMLAKIKDPLFQEELSFNTQNAFDLSRKLEDPPKGKHRKARIAVLTDGNNVSGMNMAIRAIARLAINEGIEVLGIKGGFAGLTKGFESMITLEWSMLEMKSILRRAGTLLGVSANDFMDDDAAFSTIKTHVENLKVDGIITIGNRKTYHYSHKLSHMTQLPVIGIPAALNCGLPGTDWVIGMDTALNDLVNGIERAVDAARVKKRIFIVHLKGEYCHCLVKLAALAGGAEKLIIDERRLETDGSDIFQDTVRKKIKELETIISLGKYFATIIFFSDYPEKAESAIQQIKQNIKDSSLTLETTVIPLETAYGGCAPTAFDRVLAKRLGEKAIVTLQERMDKKEYGFNMAGINGKTIVVDPYNDTPDSVDYRCSGDLESELQYCFDLMSQPGKGCIGMGGNTEWTDTRSNEKQWEGVWNCKKCGHSQTFSFNPKKMLCVYCENEMCHNYGYIRISRRL
jgi:6-phosphofructokinase 1